MILSAICFTFSSYYGKVVTTSTNMSSTMTSFSRFILGTLIIALYMILTKKSFKPNNKKAVLMRAILNCSATIIYSWALNYTTITNVNMLNMVYPVIVILLAPLITKEKISKSTYLYLVLIMTGIYLVSNPSFTHINIGDAGSLVSALLSGLSILALKEAIKHDEAYLILFYVNLIGIFVNIPLVYKDILSFEISGIVPILLSALLGFGGQNFQTLSYKTIDSATGSLISTSRIIMAAIVGYLLLSEPIDLRIIIGIILILISLIGVSGHFKRRKEKLLEI